MDGGEALVRTMIAHGMEVGFTVPGESFLTVLEALRRQRNRFRLVSVRQEGGGAFAAEAYGKLTGKPAAVLVSRGPGASNAAVGLHTARQDSTPLLLVIGHVRRRSRGREAFQEVDHHAMFASLAKAVIEPAAADEIPEAAARAIAKTTEGRPGPVVLVLPRDLTEAEIGEPELPEAAARATLTPEPDLLADAAELLRDARRPLIIAGEQIPFEGAHGALVDFASALGAPVMAAYRRQDVLDNEHPAYAGHLEINRVDFQRGAFADCDLLIAAGSRLDGITAEDDALLRDGLPLLHIHPDAEVLMRFGADLAIRADSGPTLAALTPRLSAPPTERLDWRDGLHQAFLTLSTPGAVPVAGELDLARIAYIVDTSAPADRVILTDAGSFSRWIHRYTRSRGPRSTAGPMSGAMGYAVPGAIGAHLARPEAAIIAYVGDGGFMMTGQELMTAIEQDLPVKVIVCDNAAQGSILAGQVSKYGEAADYATRLQSPDFAAVAAAYGAPSWTVTRTDEFTDAFEAALTHTGPALIHVLTDTRDIAPYGTGKDAV